MVDDSNVCLFARGIGEFSNISLNSRQNQILRFHGNYANFYKISEAEKSARAVSNFVLNSVFKILRALSKNLLNARIGIPNWFY